MAQWELGTLTWLTACSGPTLPSFTSSTWDLQDWHSGREHPGEEQGGSSHHPRACSSLFSTSCPTHHLLSSSVLLAQPHLLCYHGLLDGTPSSCEDH